MTGAKGTIFNREKRDPRFKDDITLIKLPRSFCPMHFYLAARTIDGFYKGGPSKRLERVFSVQIRIDE